MLDFDLRRDLPTVLLIDDDLVSREVTATILTLDGFTVHTAADGASAVELLAGGGCDPAVVLMDIQMDGLSGLQLVERLRSQCSARIFAVSASKPSDEIAAATDGSLLKPYTPQALTALLGEQVLPVVAPSAKTVSGAPSLVSRDGTPLTKPASEGDEADPVISPQTLAQLREMMPDAAVRQIYSAIVADLAKREKALEIAFATDDAREVRRIGHAIKGGCGMAGALQIARLGARLESGGLESNGNHLDNSTTVLNDLRRATANLKSMLDAEFPA